MRAISAPRSQSADELSSSRPICAARRIPIAQLRTEWPSARLLCLYRAVATPLLDITALSKGFPGVKALEAVDPWGYGVATIEEGTELRAAGIARPVLVFMPARPDLYDAYEAHRLTPALGDRASIHSWIERGARGGAFHLEIDTGMSRSGVRWDEIEPIVDLLDTPYLEGCYTHFHSADRHDGSAEAQLERFKAAAGRLARRPPLLHVANSAAALRGKAFALDMIRPGICLYGATPGAGLPTGR